MDEKYYSINANQDKDKIFFIDAHQARRIMGNTKKFLLLFLREGKHKEEGSELDMKASLEGCSGEKHQQLKQLIEAYKEVFQ
jgi:hypothetical protein